MIPIRDTQRPRVTPVINLTLIAINVGVWLYELGLSESQLYRFILKWGVIPAVITNQIPREALMHTSGLMSLVTSLFIHAGWVHIIGNMLYLFIFGDNVEDLLGHWGYLGFYFTVGIGASLLHIYFDPLSVVPTVGASGAIAGVLGAYFIHFPRSRVLALIPVGLFLPMVELPSIVFLFLWFLTNLFSGVASLGVPAQAGVAWWAHIGGFVAGMAFSYVLRQRRVRSY